MGMKWVLWTGLYPDSSGASEACHQLGDGLCVRARGRMCTAARKTYMWMAGRTLTSIH